MRSEDKGKEQLIDELAQVRQEIGEIGDRLNNILTATFGNIGLAKKIYEEKGASKDKVLESLVNAEKTLTDIRNLTRRLLTLSYQ